MKVLPQWLRDHTGPSLRLDTIAGLSLAAFVIPESLAYASLADLPPVSGLYCYLVAGIAYAVLGTSRQLAVGPTSSLAIAVAASIAVVSGGDPARAVANASAIAVLLGIIASAAGSSAWPISRIPVRHRRHRLQDGCRLLYRLDPIAEAVWH